MKWYSLKGVTEYRDKVPTARRGTRSAVRGRRTYTSEVIESSWRAWFAVDLEQR